MAATPITVTDRYIHPEVMKIYYLDTIAAYLTAVTRAELNAGMDLTAEVAEAPNWGVSANRVPVPDLGKKFVSRISGRIEPGDSQIVFYASRTTADIRTVLARGHAGYVVILYGGDITGRKMDVFPNEVSAVSKPVDMSGGPALITIDFSITKIPAEDLVIPA